MNQTHFRIHEDFTRWRKMKMPGYKKRVHVARIVCDEGCAAAQDTVSLRADTAATCPKCCVIKDAWLSASKRKPLTIRRAREMRAALSGTTP